MKTLHLRELLVALLLLVLPLPFACAQNDDEIGAQDTDINLNQDKVLKLYPLQPGEIYLAYEKLRSSRISNQIGISYVYSGFLKGDDFFPDVKRVNGLAIRMSQRRYVSKKKDAPMGFFHGPMFGYRFLVFEKNALGQEDLPANDPNYTFIGRLYQNSLDLSYLVGTQTKLGKNLTLEIAGGLGGRASYARAVGANELLADRMIGHVLISERNTAIAVVPLPQLHIAIGYAF